MLRDELLMSRYAKRLDSLCELCDKEVHRTRSDPQFGPLAWHYREHLYHLRRLFHDRYRRDLISAFKRLQDAGALEIITCGATHGFLPLMVHPEAIRAQIQVACMHYRMHFGRDPRGIWLPECAYSDTLDKDMFELLLKWRMRCEPWPLGEVQRHVLDAYLRREARRHGFGGWIHAHHSLRQPVARPAAAPISAKPSSKARPVTAARTKATV